jgi:TolA-binding protein
MRLRKTEASADALLKAIAGRQDSLESQLRSLASAVESLEKRLTERSELSVFSAHEDTVELLDASESSAAPARKHGMKAEVRAVIAAAAAVAGEIAKVHKVRAMPAAQDARSAWSQQGRVGVVSSHRLR